MHGISTTKAIFLLRRLIKIYQERSKHGVIERKHMIKYHERSSGPLVGDGKENSPY